jgi:hypothetical protein
MNSTRSASSPDRLTKASTKDNSIELTEEELKRTSGGATGGGSAKDPITIHHFSLE